jgi:hypothetical protein
MKSEFPRSTYSFKPSEHHSSVSPKLWGKLARTIYLMRYKGPDRRWIQLNYGVGLRYREPTIFVGDFDLEGTQSYFHELVLNKGALRLHEIDYNCLGDENLIIQGLEELKERKLDLFDLRDEIEFFLFQEESRYDTFPFPRPRLTFPYLHSESGVLEEDVMEDIKPGRYIFI